MTSTKDYNCILFDFHLLYQHLTSTVNTTKAFSAFDFVNDCSGLHTITNRLQEAWQYTFLQLRYTSKSFELNYSKVNYLQTCSTVNLDGQRRQMLAGNFNKRNNTVRYGYNHFKLGSAYCLGKHYTMNICLFHIWKPVE